MFATRQERSPATDPDFDEGALFVFSERDPAHDAGIDLAFETGGAIFIRSHISVNIWFIPFELTILAGQYVRF